GACVRAPAVDHARPWRQYMKRIATSLAAIAIAAVVAACSGADAGSSQAPSEAPSGAPSADAGALQISAKDIKFSTDTLEAKAGEPITIVFENQESAPHNVAIYTDESASEKIFAEEPFSGPKTVTYNVPAQDAGTYYFHCDLHPNMAGSLV